MKVSSISSVLPRRSLRRTHQQKGRGLTDAVRLEPRRLVSYAQHAVQLVAAKAFLAGAEQMHRLELQVQRDMRALKHGAYRDAELAFAWVATPQTEPAALHLRNAIRAAALRANRAVRRRPRHGRGHAACGAWIDRRHHRVRWAAGIGASGPHEWRQAVLTMSGEVALLLGRAHGLPGCAASAYP